jgi:hypothetical protein
MNSRIMINTPFWSMVIRLLLNAFKFSIFPECFLVKISLSRAVHQDISGLMDTCVPSSVIGIEL